MGQQQGEPRLPSALLATTDQPSAEPLSKRAHPSQSEGPDDVLRKRLHLYASHFEVPINLRVVRPVLVTLDLNNKTGTRFTPPPPPQRARGYVPALHPVRFQEDRALSWLVTHG